MSTVKFSVNISESIEFDAVDGPDDDVFEEKSMNMTPLSPRSIPLKRLVSRFNICP
jgi:hypothetical protein